MTDQATIERPAESRPASTEDEPAAVRSAATAPSTTVAASPASTTAAASPARTTAAATAPSTTAAASRTRTIAAALGNLIRRHPFTASIVAAFIVAESCAALAAGPMRSVLAWVGTGVGPVVEQGHWWTPITSLFFADGALQFVFALIAVIALVGVSETLMGWRRTAVAFFVTGVAGTMAGIGIQLAGEQVGELWAHAVFGIVTVTPFLAACGAIATASAFAGPLWRRRIRLLSLLVAIVFVLYSGHPSDVYRLGAIVAGIVLGIAIGPKMTTRKSGWARSSHREIRVLMASVVAITAIGPVIALLSHARFGPLSPISLLFASHLPAAGDAVAPCPPGSLSDHCAQAFALDPMHGVGMILLSLFPLALLVAAAYGLVYGSRFAVWVAISVNVLLSASAVVSFGIFQAIGSGPRTTFLTAHHGEILAGLVVSALLPLAVAVTLFALRGRFTVAPSGRLVRRFAFTVAGSGLALGFIYLGGTVLGGGAAYLSSLTAPEVLADATQRFIPVHFWALSHPGSLPTTILGNAIYHGVGPVFWIIVIIAALRPMFGSTVGGPVTDAAHARELVMRGGDALGFMTTWQGNRYWFDTEDEAGVAYRVVNGIAITTGGPIGSPVSEDATMRRFARFCDDNGWVPVFYSVDGSLTPVFEGMGWATMVVAEEAVLSPQTWSMTGKKWQDVRSSINRAARAGIRAEWTTYAELSIGLQAQLAEISEEWIADKDLPEMGFTLGGMDELRDPAVRLMLAIDEDGRVEAVTSWLPMFREGRIFGWTLDFMRRRAGSINGVMEFLIASSAEQMQRDGIEVMSLSGAPLANASGVPQAAGTLNTVLDYLSASLEPVYGFQSLLRFKRKFQPEFRPLIMAYPDTVALPRIGIALTRAYLPGLSMSQAAGLMRSH